MKSLTKLENTLGSAVSEIFTDEHPLYDRVIKFLKNVFQRTKYLQRSCETKDNSRHLVESCDSKNNDFSL